LLDAASATAVSASNTCTTGRGEQQELLIDPGGVHVAKTPFADVEQAIEDAHHALAGPPEKCPHILSNPGSPDGPAASTFRYRSTISRVAQASSGGNAAVGPVRTDQAFSVPFAFAVWVAMKSMSAGERPS